MKKLKMILMLAAGMFVAVSCDDDDDDQDNVTSVSETDRTFAVNAADGGMFEVRAGEMAVAKGDSSAMGVMMGADSMSIKSFGQMMITDHTMANNELKSISDPKKVDLPTTVSNAKQLKLDSLNAASGVAFNRLYAKMMVASHQETIALFQSESTGGQDNELKTWATQKLPNLNQHLEMAQMLNDEVK
ncbi:DUF4142 domain-containing protein [Dyadobacter sp. CY326]|uniref:DUF4142 domain-containing protein n=1 Tax=Dyadobacter sp. CY326 TaxID=2907300 RepID=UPI001F332551|nr:DUF4142 domain-containing protein [Dyadobacter sp. CY326]MCE7067015.1 DUF4142 domain-containing protein [Dyadobacter sp. CY326]